MRYKTQKSARMKVRSFEGSRCTKETKGSARADLGDTMYTSIGVADLGGRILKWSKIDEKL